MYRKKDFRHPVTSSSAVPKLYTGWLSSDRRHNFFLKYGADHSPVLRRSSTTLPSLPIGAVFPDSSGPIRQHAVFLLE
ncbi:hypothetical protein AMELA_G00215180 [Ameiurus melas]|uniref:Uncharacterized protein n=1 Tax=Ameiurus melas TaxID=219545 RepID=A0A7J6A0P0_AMEME|nr:hypothetical protein AMELA_G00215180 [Ameiurus melas]